ncbi:MAG: DUF2239 family protein [Novosphingobium sp.]|nr:DUF2239 family protein [Novosphingobium sp.]
MPVTLFLKEEVLARGSAEEVAAILSRLEPTSRSSNMLAFDDETGSQVDLDVRGVMPKPAQRGRGRPSLGVEGREVTLLPRQWKWLSQQRGGASATLRRLVDEARKREGGKQMRTDAAYRFLSAIAGDMPGYEEAIRSLFADDRGGFERHAAGWPPAIREYAGNLAWPGGEG